MSSNWRVQFSHPAGTQEYLELPSHQARIRVRLLYSPLVSHPGGPNTVISHPSGAQVFRFKRGGCSPQLSSPSVMVAHQQLPPPSDPIPKSVGCFRSNGICPPTGPGKKGMCPIPCPPASVAHQRLPHPGVSTPSTAGCIRPNGRCPPTGLVHRVGPLYVTPQ